MAKKEYSFDKIADKAASTDIALSGGKTDLSKKYVGYDDASEERKKRIEARDQRKQDRYAASKERVDAKRERYADKMEGKGIMSKDEAKTRFDNLRGITYRSREEMSKIMDNLSADLNLQQEPEVVDTTQGTASFRM